MTQPSDPSTTDQPDRPDRPEASPPDQPPARRQRRWRRRLVWGTLGVTLLAVAAVVATGYHLTRPERLARLGERLIADATGAAVRVGDARLEWSGYLTLHDVHLHVRDLPHDAGELFHARAIRVAADPATLFTRSPRAETVTVTGPTLYVTELIGADGTSYNYQHLPAPDRDDPTDWLTRRLPAIHVHDATVVLAEWRDDALHRRGELHGVAQLLPLDATPATYRVLIEQQMTSGESGPRLHGTLDPARQRFDAELDRFRFTGTQRGLLPAAVHQWWDRLDPQGALPAVRVRYDPVRGLTAAVRFEDVAMNVPVPDLPARLSHVTGELALEGTTLRIVDELTGRFGDVRYRVTGRIDGLDRDAPLDVTLSTEPFVIPEHIEPSPQLPRLALEHFRRYDAAGRFRASVRAHREQRGAEIDFAGVVEILGARGRYHRFPYTLHDVHGRVRFDRDEVVIEHLTGIGPAGGRARLTGRVAPPGRHPEVDLRIVAENVPFDDALLEAIPLRQRELVEMFFDRKAYAQLVDMGVIERATTRYATDGATPETGLEPADEPAPRPAFALGGALNGEVHIHQPAGAGARTDVSLDLAGRGAHVLFAHWPYPLEVIGGRLRIARDHVDVDDLHVRGLTGASGVIRGELTPDADGRLTPELRIDDVRLPVDELLLATIPEPQDRWLRDLDLRAVVDASGRVFHDDDGRTDFAVEFRADGGSMHPFDTRLELGDVNGVVRLERDGVAWERFTGRDEQTTLTSTGRVRWAGDRRGYTVHVDGEAIPLGARLIQALPADHAGTAPLAGHFETRRPTGVFDFTLDYESDRESMAGDAADAADAADGAAPLKPGDGDYTLALRPRQLAFDWQGQHIALTDMAGEAVVTPDAVTFDRLYGEADAASASVTGRVTRAAPVEATLELEAHVRTFDDMVRAALPEPVRVLLERLEVDGALRLERGELRWAEREVDGGGDVRPRVTFDGRIALDGLSMALGLSIDELHGALDLRYADGDIGAAEGTPSMLDAVLNASRLRVAGRELTRLRFELGQPERFPGALAIRKLEGRLYEGIVTGDGRLDLDGAGGYELDLAMQNVQLAPLLDPEAARASNTVNPNAQRGHVDAGLTLKGAYRQGAERRGRGMIRVRDAGLLEDPLTMAVLQAANLALPLAGGFDSATIRYLVEGDTVRLESVRLDSPTLVIVGGGTMNVSTQALDLTLFVRNPAGDAFGPFAEMLNTIRDELMAIRVGGTLQRPQPRVVSLENVRGAWQRVFE